MIIGNVEKSYNYIPTLNREHIARNHASHIEYLLEDDRAFQRMFVTFKSCIQGFKMGCKPFLGGDGCHLQSKYLGTLLAATILDGNNGLFSVAFAVVEGEFEMSWTWFLQHLKEALETELDNITIISDQEKGLQGAIGMLFSHAEHIICMRHL